MGVLSCATQTIGTQHTAQHGAAAASARAVFRAARADPDACTQPLLSHSTAGLEAELCGTCVF